ncbi:hypothetical protein Srufu_036680 [Streptomyces libani subsp. rufus]|nr:hypothetical protein Srufu_036680 [Streptomyces libani subsp. rufus]
MGFPTPSRDIPPKGRFTVQQDITGGIGRLGEPGATGPGPPPVAQFSRTGRTLPSQRTSRARVMAT